LTYLNGQIGVTAAPVHQRRDQPRTPPLTLCGIADLQGRTAKALAARSAGTFVEITQTSSSIRTIE
jgi:hypothetical protein